MDETLDIVAVTIVAATTRNIGVVGAVITTAGAGEEEAAACT
jgi:hypothetical protein